MANFFLVCRDSRGRMAGGFFNIGLQNTVSFVLGYSLGTDLRTSKPFVHFDLLMYKFFLGFFIHMY